MPKPPDPASEPSSRLRLPTLALAGAQAIYWLWTMAIAVKEMNNLYADGLGMAPAFFATPPFLVTTLPALFLAVLGLAPRIALFLAVAGAVLTPLIVWQMLLAHFLDAIFL